jgi:hypothetical protein
MDTSAIQEIAKRIQDFWDQYTRLSEHGVCDIPGRKESQRVFAEWLAFGMPETESFIRLRASFVPVPSDVMDIRDVLKIAVANTPHAEEVSVCITREVWRFKGDPVEDKWSVYASDLSGLVTGASPEQALAAYLAARHEGTTGIA